MTAFEQAFALLKMPLDLDSIKVHRRNESDIDYDDWVDAEAEFVHPETGERFPMYVGPSGFAFTDDMHGGHTVRIEDILGTELASAETRPMELEAMSEDDHAGVNEWLSEYGGVPTDKWTVERLIEEDESILPLIEEMRASQQEPLDQESAMRFLENRKHTGDKLRVDEDYRRLGMGTALYDLLHAVGKPPTPDVNQDLLGRLMWLKNQGITDHKFAPLQHGRAADINHFPHSIEEPKGKRRGDLEYDFARLGSVEPPRWRGLKERMEAGE